MCLTSHAAVLSLLHPIIIIPQLSFHQSCFFYPAFKILLYLIPQGCPFSSLLPLLSPPPQPCFTVDSLLAFCPSFFHLLQEPVPRGKQHKVQASCCQAAVSFSAFPAATHGVLRVVAARLPACSSCLHHWLPSPSLATHWPSLSPASTKPLLTCPCSFPFSDSSFPCPLLSWPGSSYFNQKFKWHLFRAFFPDHQESKRPSPPHCLGHNPCASTSVLVYLAQGWQTAPRSGVSRCIWKTRVEGALAAVVLLRFHF